MSQVSLWDTLSADYDRFVNWPERLRREMPTLEAILRDQEARRVLDVACDTGHHAIALAERGYEVLGVDASEGMIDRARDNAGTAGVTARFLNAGFGDLRSVVEKPFDAVLCLGNSLPGLLNADALQAALVDMAGVLVPSGVLLVQNLNYDRVWPRRERFLPLESSRQDEEEWLFLRFVDFHDRTLTFNMVTLHRQNGVWDHRAGSTELRPIFKDDLEILLHRAGFVNTKWYGDYSLGPYESDTSGDLIVLAQNGPAKEAAEERKVIDQAPE